MSTRILEDIKDLGKKAVDTAKEVINHPEETAEKVVDTVKEAAQHPLDTAKKVVDKVTDTVKEVASDAAEDIKDATEGESGGSELAEKRDELRKEVEFKAYFDKLVQICIPPEDFMDISGGDFSSAGGLEGIFGANGIGIVSLNFVSMQMQGEGWADGRKPHNFGTPFTDAVACNIGDGRATVGPGLTDAAFPGVIHMGAHLSGEQILALWKQQLCKGSAEVLRVNPAIASLPQGCKDMAVIGMYSSPRGFSRLWKHVTTPQQAAQAALNMPTGGGLAQLIHRHQAEAAICLGQQAGGAAKQFSDAYYHVKPELIKYFGSSGQISGAAGGFADNGGMATPMAVGSISAPTNVQGWNLQATVNYLMGHATRKSRHICAQAVREGLQAGGLNMNGHPTLARQYVEFLPSKGFQCVARVPSNNLQGYLSQAKVGDIAVYQKPGNPSAAGHICVCCGTMWCSDFIQMSPFVYRGNTILYIFRRGSGGGRAAAAFGGSLTGSAGIYEPTHEEKAQQELEKLAKNPAMIKHIKKIAERLNATGSDGRTVAQRLLAWHQYREYNGSNIGFREYK